MTCQPTDVANEFEFVAALIDRSGAASTCCGPLVRLKFSEPELNQIDRALLSTLAEDLLWGGFDRCKPLIDGMTFMLCALHWLELACLVTLRGRRNADKRTRLAGERLIGDLCRAQGWDPREIANAFAWSQVRLT